MEPVTVRGGRTRSLLVFRAPEPLTRQHRCDRTRGLLLFRSKHPFSSTHTPLEPFPNYFYHYANDDDDTRTKVARRFGLGVCVLRSEGVHVYSFISDLRSSSAICQLSPCGVPYVFCLILTGESIEIYSAMFAVATPPLLSVRGTSSVTFHEIGAKKMCVVS